MNPGPVSHHPRLFLAISAGELAGRLKPLSKKLKMNADQKDFSIRWTPAESLHITLFFFGETGPEQQIQIEKAAEAACRQREGFDLAIDGLGAFPSEQSGRVLWLGVQNSKKLRGFHEELAAELKAQGCMVESEGYIPHLTIGRLRNPRSLRDFLSPFRRADLGKLRVTEVTLFESIQAGPFPIYQPRRQFSLATNADGISGEA